MKKKLLLGLAGALLSLVSDLLLGWMVYPAEDYFMGMLLGCADLSWARLGLSAFFGGIGIPMQALGFMAMADIIGGKAAKYVRAGTWSTAALGGSVHILCVALMAMLKQAYALGFDPAQAATMLEAIPAGTLQFTLWGVLPFSVVMMIPYYAGAAAMLVAILRRRTPLPRWMALLNPLTASIALNSVSMLAPNTALTNGLNMANMAFGGILPFAGALLWLHFSGKASCAQADSVAQS